MIKTKLDKLSALLKKYKYSEFSLINKLMKYSSIDLKAGDEVTVIRGPKQGLKGVVLDIDDSKVNAQVECNLFGRKIVFSLRIDDLMYKNKKIDTNEVGYSEGGEYLMKKYENGLDEATDEEVLKIEKFLKATLSETVHDEFFYNRTGLNIIKFLNNNSEYISYKYITKDNMINMFLSILYYIDNFKNIEIFYELFSDTSYKNYLKYRIRGKAIKNIAENYPSFANFLAYNFNFSYFFEKANDSDIYNLILKPRLEENEKELAYKLLIEDPETYVLLGLHNQFQTFDSFSISNPEHLNKETRQIALEQLIKNDEIDKVFETQLYGNYKFLDNIIDTRILNQPEKYIKYLGRAFSEVFFDLIRKSLENVYSSGEHERFFKLVMPIIEGSVDIFDQESRIKIRRLIIGAFKDISKVNKDLYYSLELFKFNDFNFYVFEEGDFAKLYFKDGFAKLNCKILEISYGKDIIFELKNNEIKDIESANDYTSFLSYINQHNLSKYHNYVIQDGDKFKVGWDAFLLHLIKI